MKKILILGAAGMAGHVVYYYLKSLNKYEIFTTCFRTKIKGKSVILDVYNRDELRNLLKEINPDYIINCIGILIRGSKESPENAVYVNAYFPHLLAQLIKENALLSRIIHISTDCVFSGSKGGYTDTDAKDALDVYGMTKNLGEIIDNEHLTIRTSIIGPELKENGEGLFHWIFARENTGKITGWEKSIWGGVTTLELAKAVEQCMVYGIAGLYQLSNGDTISKYSLINIIIKEFNLNIDVKQADGVITDKSIVQSYRDSFKYIVPPYPDMIKELHKFMHEHTDLYQYYLR